MRASASFCHAAHDVIERAAERVAVLIDGAVVDGKHPLGVFGGHSEEGRDHHPEKGAGAARDQRGGDAHNVAGADGGGHGGAERAEAGNFTVAALLVFHHVAQGPPEMPDLQPAEQAGEKDSGGEDQHDERQSPDEVVNFFEYLLDLFEHTILPFFLIGASRRALLRGIPGRGVFRPLRGRKKKAKLSA